MYPVSTAYRSFINTSRTRRPKSKIIVDGITYTGESHLKTYPKISHAASKMIGGFPAKTCEFEIYNRDGSINLNGKEVAVYRGLEINGAVEWIPMGLFSATDDNISNNKTAKTISFKGTDRTAVFDCVYGGSLTYPCTLLQFVQEICNRHGITLETAAFPFATSWTLTSAPNIAATVTDRELISRVAELGGSIAQISRNGGLCISRPYTTNTVINKARKYKTVSREPIFGPINSVVLGHRDYEDDVIFPATPPANLCEWRIEDNPFVEGIREEVVEDIAAQIIGRSLIPFQLNDCIDDYVYDINDIVRIQDKDGSFFLTTILQIDTASRIKSTLKAETQTENSTNYEIAGSVQQAVKQARLMVDHQNNTIQTLVEDVTSLSGDVTGLENDMTGLEERTASSIIQMSNSILSTVQTTYATKSEAQATYATKSTVEQLSDSVNFRFENLATPSGVSNAVTTINAQGVSVINGAFSLYDNSNNLLIGINTDGSGNMKVVGRIDAAAITTGVLDAARIAANSITTDKLLVGDLTNLCRLNALTYDSYGFMPVSSTLINYAQQITQEWLMPKPAEWKSQYFLGEWVDFTYNKDSDNKFLYQGEFYNRHTSGTVCFCVRAMLSDGTTYVFNQGTADGDIYKTGSGYLKFSKTIAINPSYLGKNVVKIEPMIYFSTAPTATYWFAVNNLTFRRANGGDITAGKIQSLDGTSYFDLDNNLLVSQNAQLSGEFVSLSKDTSGNIKTKLKIKGEAWNSSGGNVMITATDASDGEIGFLKFNLSTANNKTATLSSPGDVTINADTETRIRGGGGLITLENGLITISPGAAQTTQIPSNVSLGASTSSKIYVNGVFENPMKCKGNIRSGENNSKRVELTCDDGKGANVFFMNGSHYGYIYLSSSGVFRKFVNGVDSVL